MKNMKKPKIKVRVPRLGGQLANRLAHRKAGAHKHRNTPRGGSKKDNHFEGWD